MTLEEQYTRLLEKERDKDIIDFFKERTADERRSLAPLVKKLGKEYFEFVQQGNTWRSKATDKQRHILNYSFFACYNKKEIEKENPAWMLCREQLEKFLPWYVPAWLNEYVNGFSGKDWLPFGLDYGYLVELTERGFLQPDPQLIARLLPSFVYEQINRDSHFAPERLLQHSITLQEHVWTIFQYETDVHVTERYRFYKGKKIEQGWIDVFQLFAGDKLDRRRLLQEALLAGNRGFNKNLSGWFAELFLKLSPTPEEVIALQGELFTLFSSPHSKVVNTALQVCKIILGGASFQVTAFLDYAPVLLASDKKSVVTGGLQVLEKLAKDNKEERPRIAEIASAALVHKDEGLQSRAAKLIQRFASAEDEALQQTLVLYSGSLFSAAKNLLAAFLPQEDAPTTEAAQTEEPSAQKPSLTNQPLLPQIQSADELIFLAAQAFDNNESWHIDLLPAAMVHCQKGLSGADVVKLEPAIQRALKLFFGDWRSTQGNLDQLLACLFLDWCLWLVQQHPAETASAKALFKTFMYKTEANKKLWDDHGTANSFLAGWTIGEKRQVYLPYKNLFDAVLVGLKKGSDLPLLCAPTHSPAWIDPLVLVKRFWLYQQENVWPDDTDLQIALSRCWLHEPEDAVALVKQTLAGEMKELLLFLLQPGAAPLGPFTKEAAWMAAALSKAPQAVYPQLSGLTYSQKPRASYTGQYPWQTMVETYTYDKYDWQNGKYTAIKTVGRRKVISLDLSAQTEQKPKEGSLKKFFSKLTGSKESAPEPAPLLYNYLRISEQWLSVEDRDIRRIYLLTPNNLEPVLALALSKCLLDFSFFDETKKRLVVNLLQAVHDTMPGLEETGHLFVATCLLCADKTAANYAAEVWVKGVDGQRINSRLLGSILGKHERIELAPLKRFTDLVMSNLLGLSAAHNKALEVLVAALLKELPVTPIKNLKKLLEIYSELLQLTGSTIGDEELKNKLLEWKATASLSKAIKAVV